MEVPDPISNMSIRHEPNIILSLTDIGASHEGISSVNLFSSGAKFGSDALAGIPLRSRIGLHAVNLGGR
jgi:hypothetical protein